MNVNGDYKVLLALPAWNEEQSIGKVLQELKVAYSDFDIIVVNDGSTDATARVAQEKGAKVIAHDRNLGYTAALQTGRVYALESNYDFLVFIDADAQHRPSDISKILDPLVNGDADQVRGSRELGKYEWEEPFYLKIPRWICSTLVSLKAKKIVTDATSGFKGENRKVMEHLKLIYETSDKVHQSNTNDVEEHLIALKNGFRLMEVPVVMRRRQNGSTKCYRLRQLMVFPLDLIRVFWRNW